VDPQAPAARASIDNVKDLVGNGIATPPGEPTAEESIRFAPGLARPGDGSRRAIVQRSGRATWRHAMRQRKHSRAQGIGAVRAHRDLERLEGSIALFVGRDAASKS